MCSVVSEKGRGEGKGQASCISALPFPFFPGQGFGKRKGEKANNHN